MSHRVASGAAAVVGEAELSLRKDTWSTRSVGALPR